MENTVIHENEVMGWCAPPPNQLPAEQAPVYRSHKTVRALKIRQIIIFSDHEQIQFEDDSYAIRCEPIGWAQKHDVKSDDAGYWVMYEDGYTSWSPKKAFEGGYHLVESGECEKDG